MSCKVGSRWGLPITCTRLPLSNSAERAESPAFCVACVACVLANAVRDAVLGIHPSGQGLPSKSLSS